MQQHLTFKLDQNPNGRGLRCDESGLFLGREPLLQQDENGKFEGRSIVELQKLFARVYCDETNWESRIRSVKLVANALNKGEMARAMMTAVLMRLPDPHGPVRLSDVDGELVKAGFNPDEPRDERGRWTNDGGWSGAPDADAARNPRIQLADAVMSDLPSDPIAEAVRAAAAARGNRGPDDAKGSSDVRPPSASRQTLGSHLLHGAGSLLEEIGREQINESNTNLAAASAGANLIASGLSAADDYLTRPLLDHDGKPIQLPIVYEGDVLRDYPSYQPVTYPATNADWVGPLADIVTLGLGGWLGAGAKVGSFLETLESAEVAARTASASEHVFATTEAVAVNGSRAIDRGASYETAVRNLYSDVPLSQRKFRAFVDGKKMIGVADNTTDIDGKLTAVDAKYVDNWATSLRNPASELGRESWAVAEQQQMIRQARTYSSNFPGGVVYHTNSVDLAIYYTNAFRKAGIRNFRFIITPATKLRKKMVTNYMERIFGEGAFERRVPGTRPGEDSTVRYIAFDDAAFIPELFDLVADKVKPPLVASGGIVLEGTRLSLPDGRRFFAVLMNGDLEGWRKQIEQGASALGRTTAKIIAGDVLVSDGRSYPLSSCEIEFV